MAYRSLREFIDVLETKGELVRVTEPVSSVLEMTEIQTRLLATSGPAVLFEHVLSQPQLTRSFKALKLWMSLRTFGLDAFRQAIEVGFDMADEADRLLRADPRWEVVTPAQMGIITFRWKGDGSLAPERIDAITSRVADDMRLDGYALVLSTVLYGRPVLRLCPIHPGTNAEEIAETIRRLTDFSKAAEG